MTTYVFYGMPGHGYLKIPISDVRKAGVIDQISHCSPIHGGDYYLEEDCDVPLFMKDVGIGFGDVAEITVEKAPFE